MAHILIVDDEPDLRSELQDVLEREGHVVVSAGDGLAALRSLDRQDFDLLITDLMMPESDGIELIREYRKICTSPKILAMSGARWENGDPLAMAEALGATASIRKPFRSLALLSKIDEILTGPS